MTACRSLKASSLRTILPLHSTTAKSPILSVPRANIRVLRIIILALPIARVMPHVRGNFCAAMQPEPKHVENFREANGKICATAFAVQRDEMNHAESEIEARSMEMSSS
jgi:hypothetical protein